VLSTARAEKGGELHHIETQCQRLRAILRYGMVLSLHTTHGKLKTMPFVTCKLMRRLLSAVPYVWGGGHKASPGKSTGVSVVCMTQPPVLSR
jgi:hypothetical protein